MTPQVIILSSATSTAWIPVDYKQNPFNIGLSLVFSNTPNLTCKVEYTLDDVFNTSITPTAFAHGILVNVTSNSTGTISSPVKAIRLTVTSWTSGTVTLTALQGVVNPRIYTASENAFSLKSRRPMYPVNLLSPSGSTSAVQTLGTVTVAGTHPNPRTFTCLATGTGSTARIIGSPGTQTLDITKMYEFSATVVEYSVANQGAMTRSWLEASSNVVIGTPALLMSSTIPVVGTRYAIRFTPSQASNIFRIGFGCNNPENVTSGDKIVFSDIQLCEVDSLTGSPIDFSFSNYGSAGKTASPSDSIGSCVIVCGDSWMNDAADPGPLLGSVHGREVIISATAGWRLDQISTDLSTKLSAGNISFYRPNFHFPTFAVVEGGINDVTADATSSTMFLRLQTIIDTLTSNNIKFLVVLPTLATDAALYTAARGAVIDEYHKRCYLAGLNIVRPGDWCLLSTGALDPTYMLADGIHLNSTGFPVLAKQLDDEIRRIEQS